MTDPDFEESVVAVMEDAHASGDDAAALVLSTLWLAHVSGETTRMARAIAPLFRELEGRVGARVAAQEEEEGEGPC